MRWTAQCRATDSGSFIPPSPRGDRVSERNHATTDFITREIASLRLALNDVATRDFVRGELRDLLQELEEAGPETDRPEAPALDDQSLRAILREEVEAALERRTGKEQDPQ